MTLRIEVTRNTCRAILGCTVLSVLAFSYHNSERGTMIISDLLIREQKQTRVKQLTRVILLFGVRALET